MHCFGATCVCGTHTAYALYLWGTAQMSCSKLAQCRHRRKSYKLFAVDWLAKQLQSWQKTMPTTTATAREREKEEGERKRGRKNIQQRQAVSQGKERPCQEMATRRKHSSAKIEKNGAWNEAEMAEKGTQLSQTHTHIQTQTHTHCRCTNSG